MDMHWDYHTRINISKKGFIYLIKNLVNQGKYIGQKSIFKKGVKSTTGSPVQALKSWIFSDDGWNELPPIIDQRISKAGSIRHLSVQKKYTIRNIKTSEIFTGTRSYIKNKLEIKTDICHAVVSGYIKNMQERMATL